MGPYAEVGAYSRVGAYSEVGAYSNLHHFQLMRTLSFSRITKQKIRSLIHFNKTKQNSCAIDKQFKEEMLRLKEL